MIPHAFGERAVLKLVYAALIRAAERWRGIRITEFEQRQLQAIRDEIDQNFTARNAPIASTTVTAALYRPSASEPSRIPAYPVTGASRQAGGGMAPENQVRNSSSGPRLPD